MGNGIRTRYFISESDQSYGTLAMLGDHKAIRARMKYLIELGIKFEQLMSEGVPDNTPEETKIKDNVNSKAVEKSAKEKPMRSSVTEPVVLNKCKIPAGDEIQVWN